MADNQQGGQGGGAQNPNAGKLRADLVQAEIAARDLAKDLGYALENLKESSKILDKQANTYKGLAKSSQHLNDIAKQNVKFAQDLTALYDSELQVSSDLLLKKNMIGTQLRDDYAQLLTTYMLENDITNVNDKRIQGLVKELQHRQEIAEKLEEERDLYETVAAKTLEIREEADAYKKSLMGVLATARAIGNDPKTMGAFMLTQGIEKLNVFTEGFEELHHQGLSAGQAIEGQFKGMSMMSMLGLSDAKGVVAGMAEQYGNINALSGETVDKLGQMAHHFGISGQEAAKLNASMSQIPGETAASAANAMEHVGHMAEMQGIAPGKIMKDMAANTGEMARAGAKGAEEFGKSVIELHKMGVEMQTASKIADGLLDFESSINAQNEASVLLGREINLDKARELALNNDLEGATKEVLKNIGGSVEFNKMNRLEQDALAKSAGMTVEELTKSLDAQEETNKYYGEGASLLDNMAGKALEVGAGVGGFLKENGLLIMSTVQFMDQFNILTKAGNALLAIKNGLLKAGQFLMGKGGAAKAAGGAADAVSGAAADSTKTAAASGGKAASSGLKGLAEGLSDMGTGKVAKGALNLLFLAAPALILMLAAIPTLAFISLLGVPAGAGLKALGEGVESFGSGKALMGAGVILATALAVTALGAATILFAAGGAAGTALMIVSLIALTAALAVIGGLGLSGVGFVGVALVLALGIAMLAMGAAVLLAAYGLSLIIDSFTKLFGVVSIENIGPLLLLGPAISMIGAGMLVLAVGLLVAAPAMLLFGVAALYASVGVAALGIALGILGLGVTVVAVGMVAIGFAIEKVASLVTPVKDSLISMSQAAPGLMMVAMAVGGIAAGLGLMAVAGLAALPAITALIGLAAVAPALVALGGAIGGLFGGGGDKEDKMDELIGEIRELKAIMSQGGVVNMDGKKVGDVLRLAISTSGVR